MTHRILAIMCDMRVPLAFELDDCRLITESLREVAEEPLSWISNWDREGSTTPSPLLSLPFSSPVCIHAEPFCRGL